MKYSLIDKEGIRSFLDQIVHYGKIDFLKLHSGFHDASERFKFYHFHRNYFNFETANGLHLTKAREGSNEYRCEKTNTIWLEAEGWKNAVHMPKTEAVKNTLGIGIPWSRKFLSLDKSSMKGEFEIIVHGNKNIGAYSGGDAKYQATYNFGRTFENPEAHKLLDFYPHYSYGKSYEPYSKTKGEITIDDGQVIEKKSIGYYSGSLF